MSTEPITDIKRRNPTVPLTELEQSAFCQAEPLNSKSLHEELGAGVKWQHIPIEYAKLPPEHLVKQIDENKKKLGDDVVILGHHYQRQDVIQFADYKGDSFQLSQFAANDNDSRYIIFCGVHFMAETAAILGRPDQQVLLPNINAGCSMADMAPTLDVQDCWNDLLDLLGEGEIIPVTYMNSTAAIKGLCGKYGGIVCTSSNAESALRWAYKQAPKVLFLPDQHLGRNTGTKLGIDNSEMAIWNPFKPLGGNTVEQLRSSKLVLWKGHCSVHTRFTVAQIENAREQFPEVNVVVHPECTLDVVQAADLVGSTEMISRTISKSGKGTVWAVGTEINLVSRLANENPDKTIFCLDPIVCPCSTMYRIHPAYILWITDELLAGRVQNSITVEENTASFARLALDRMLALS